MSLRWPPKDPDEILDYSIDWGARLDGDTINTTTWTFPAGITKGAESESSGVTTVFVSGGTEEIEYTIGCRITTAGGRTMDESVKLKIKSR